MILLLALAAGVAVGNVYFPQVVVPGVADGLGVSAGAAARVVSATQAGYAAGIVLLVPLGDRIPYRRLIVGLLLLTGVGLLVAAGAPTLGVLLAAAVLTGATTVIGPIVGTMAAGLVSEGRRGRVSGMLLSGGLGGMLLSRTLGGALVEGLGWRAPYLVAAALTLAVALVLLRVLPAGGEPAERHRPGGAPSPARRDAASLGGAPAPVRRYLALLAEPLRLLVGEPLLRRSCLYQALVFAGFSAVWASITLLLTGPAYGLPASATGVLALVNAATMVITPIAGRQVDRRGPGPVTLVCLVAVIVSAPVLAAGALGGAPGMAGLAVGSLLLDLAMQSGMVANQVRVYGVRAGARGRLTTAYMACAYLGGAAGSWLGTAAYGRAGWPGVCAIVALTAAVALARHLAGRATDLPPAPRHT
ncbi:MFS transporter [[Actinomadura] parvosata subsp. kistnae]|uniref:MFS transporter n=1 Tax=[Actinomadura] parvosata subsp. kistnae TaxID=1909395 RepID=A0A1V0AJL7_9ACTN|nr:MFS transporter [Nonomuraea sp. ATCC 55076]